MEVGPRRGIVVAADCLWLWLGASLAADVWQRPQTEGRHKPTRGGPSAKSGAKSGQFVASEHQRLAAGRLLVPLKLSKWFAPRG